MRQTTGPFSDSERAAGAVSARSMPRRSASRVAVVPLLSVLLLPWLASSCTGADLAGESGKAGRSHDGTGGGRDDGGDDGGGEDAGPGAPEGSPTPGGSNPGSGDGPEADGTDAGSADGVDAGGGDGSRKDPELGVTTDGAGMIVLEDGEAAGFAAKFGLLVNDLECGLCHVKVNGDVASTADVRGLFLDTQAEVTGRWLAARGYAPASANPSRPYTGTHVEVAVAGGVQQGLKLAPDLPKDLDGNGYADFPVFDAAAIEGKMTGTVKSAGETIDKVKDGNVVLIGTADSPITVSGEVLVKGDVVIKGWYKGIGNIYATGNIYIPADLRAKSSPFPFSADVTTARQQGVQAIKDRKDALALATKKSILISDLEDYGDNNHSVYAHPATPPGRDAASLEVAHVYSWFKGGKTGYDQLYEANPLDCESGKPRNGRSFSEIDAFLYAQNTVAGRANRNSFAINGGVIADHFHVISASKNCQAGIHPIHGLDAQWSYVNYDWRMQGGLLLLKQLHRYFH